MNEKNLYHRKMRAYLDLWNEKLKDLEIKAKYAKGEIREEYLNEIEELKDEGRWLASKIDELRSSSEDSWESRRSDLEISAREFRNDLNRAVSVIE